MLLSSWPMAAQDLRIDVSKRSTPIPKSCVSVAPASIENPVDVAALVKEAICKGDGDMIIEYTYVMNAQVRGKSRRGIIREETTTYEVFIPVLKSGMHTTGILLVTHRNGVPVPPGDLDKERLRTGKRLEKEEEKIARDAPPPLKAGAQITRGMFPLGMYTSTSINRGTFGFGRGGAVLAVNDFLRTCNLTLLRREQKEGRESLVFHFAPRPDAQFDIGEKYMAHLTGEIWIDATDRIVTLLAGWPQVPNQANAPQEVNARVAVPASAERPPAVYVEMMRLRRGIWLPRLVRINGLDYPTLFEHITQDSTWIYSNYVHFFTEIRDTRVDAPTKP
jgi:hypothetical protein